MEPKQIAAVCHEANRALTKILSDVPVQPPWDDAPEEMIRSAVKGVIWRMDNPRASAGAQHDEWVRAKLEDGWKLGPVKDAEKKEHPALIPYDQLAPGVQLKDALFTAIVLAIAP